MKNFKKVTILRAVVLLLMCGLFMTPTTVSAAKKKTIKIKYKSKTVTIEEDDNNLDVLLNKMKKAWGEPDSITDEEDAVVYNYGKQNKSWISITQNKTEDHNIFIQYKMNDKNMVVNGVKVGMSKSKALKTLRKNLGKKYVKYDKEQKCIITSSIAGCGYQIKKDKVVSCYSMICIVTTTE